MSFKEITCYKTALLWAWKNRRNLLLYGFGLILLCKWSFGFVSTDKLIELVKALGSVLNPITF
jgi:hypothetical protein